MASKRPSKPESTPYYRGADVPLHVIRDFARRVAERFHPERIILFGSYAYGAPHADSDVDILVVMPAPANSPSRCASTWLASRTFPSTSSCARRRTCGGAWRKGIPFCGRS